MTLVVIQAQFVENKGKGKFQDDLAPGILVMNHKYFPSSTLEAPKNGDTDFVKSVIQVLRDNYVFCGMILYRKDHEITNTPYNTYNTDGEIKCATINFNPKRTEIKKLESLISEATTFLATTNGFTCSPILYYQDEVLLKGHPHSLPLGITHHNPVFADYARHFGEAAALDAFKSDTDSYKAQRTHAEQETGIKELKARQKSFVLQLSQLQGIHLVSSGIDPGKIFPFAPPIRSMVAAAKAASLNCKSMSQLLIPQAGRKFIFTAVARLSAFKNVELLIEGAIKLLSRGHEVELLIAGGDHSDKHSERRATLLQQVPPSFQKHVTIMPKLSKVELYLLFKSSRKTGIFVCSSRYETLGLTPLEAALSGVTTVVSDGSQPVELVRFFPAEHRFDPNAEALADRVEGIWRKDLETCGKELRRHIKKEIPEGAFETEFLEAWRKVSTLSRAACQRDECVLLDPSQLTLLNKELRR